MIGTGETIYIGCYTSEPPGEHEGIVSARRDPRTGALEPLGVAARTPSPSFLARHPRLPVVYAVNEVEDGMVSAWSSGPGAPLHTLGYLSTGGAHPCHLAVDPRGGHVMVANYGSGSVAVHALDDAGAPMERTDLVTHAGRGPHPERQDRPHPHMVTFDPSGDELWVVDLGTDAVWRYRLNRATGRLHPAGPPLATPPGMGPRHLTHQPASPPSSTALYVVSELDPVVLTYEPDDDTSGFVERARALATVSGDPSWASEIAVGDDGRFLYVANRGPDTIAVFALDSGRPRYVTEVPAGGAWPRHFAVVAGFLYVAGERSHTVTTFRLDPSTGVPTPTGNVLEVPSPACVLAPTVRSRLITR